MTSNYHLTVRRVEKALKGIDCYLLAAPANGINVWCASCGKEMNTHSIIAVIKTSRIDKHVRHRNLVLPQLSAPGIDRKLLKKETGWKAIWGPAYAEDIGDYFKNEKKIIPGQTQARFPIKFRLEALVSMNFLIWFFLGAVSIFIDINWFLYLTLIFWGSGLVLYIMYPILPSKSGWLKASYTGIIEVIGIALYSHLIEGVSWSSYWGWMALAFLINIVIGFDLKGIASGYPSEAENLFHKLKIKSLGQMYSFETIKHGVVVQDEEKCNNCQTCLNVCPKGIFAKIENSKKIRPVNTAECLSCNACVMQCPEKALSLNK